MVIMGEGHHIKLYGVSTAAPAPCRAGMGIRTCLECKLPDDIGCNEERGRHWLRDEAIRADSEAGMSSGT